MPRDLFSERFEPEAAARDRPENRDRTRFARIMPERGIDEFPEGLTYWAPPELGVLAVGDRVTVPLGRGDKPASGVVIEVAVSPDVSIQRIKPISHRTGAGVPAGLVHLARWMSRYYCTPLGMVLAAMVPAPVKRQTGRILKKVLSPTGAPIPQGGLAPSAKRAWEAISQIAADQWPIEPRDLLARLGLPSQAPINRLIRAGLLSVTVREEVRAPWQEFASEPDRGLTLSPNQFSAVETISHRLGTFSPFLLFGVTGSGKTEVYLRVLERVIADRDRPGQCAIVLVPEISLTPQTVGRFLGRFAGQGVGVAVLHSGLTAAQRHQQWARVSGGEARIVVGARSAVFAPFDAGAGRPLGLIIVDEEHDASYKQDQLPRYSARDVALRRAQLEQCPVILGSATPSLESWHNALPVAEGGAAKFTLLRLPERVGGGTLPKVRIVDLAQERKARPEGRSRELHALGPTLETALARVLAGPGQAILLLNRRGFAHYVCCADATCGWRLTCDHCDVTMVHHREWTPPPRDQDEPAPRRLDLVRCHHCLTERVLPHVCPVCGKTANTFGFGTQRVETEIVRKFPALAEGGALLRLDRDTMKRARDYFVALEKFRTGQARVLIGTQMVAKGLDFPDVRLIGVINADTALQLPDFRAAERTFQLVSQVAGRAGRSAESARTAQVIVQTMSPHEPAIVLAAAHDFENFAREELAIRRSAALPPVGRMARIVCRDRSAPKAEAACHEIAAALREWGEASGGSTPSGGRGGAASGGGRLMVKGPMPCALSRIADHYRFAVELLAADARTVQEALTALRNARLLRSDVRTAVDVDPVALL